VQPKEKDPKCRPDAVTLNKNHAAAKHVDSNNKGHSYIIGLGNYMYTGGELVFTNKKSPHYMYVWITQYQKQMAQIHYVKPFKGERYIIPWCITNGVEKKRIQTILYHMRSATCQFIPKDFNLSTSNHPDSTQSSCLGHHAMLSHPGH